MEHPIGYNNWREYAMAYRRAKGQRAVVAAVQRGILVPAKSCKCADCGKRAYCYDHRDYRKPLDVDPVCKRCDCMRGPGAPYPRIGTTAYMRLLEAAKRYYFGHLRN